MTIKKNSLTDNQRKALPHFVNCKTIEDACNKAGISKETFYRWSREPVFKESLDEFKAQSFHEAFSDLSNSLKLAVETLVFIIKDPMSPPQVRRGACTDIIHHALSWRQQNDFEERIIRLEEMNLKRR